MLYALLRPALFALDGEDAHRLSLAALDRAHALGLLRLACPAPPDAPVEVMGLRFPNAVGLAAGLDKNGEHIDALGALGFGFLEIGTVTPRPQPGNARPRLFRLPAAQALINRMGFNNAGVAALVANVRASRHRGILGINIGKNFDTPLARAAEDYLACLEAVYPYARYVTVNISSPNTQGLRDLQQEDALDHLLAALKARQRELTQRHGKTVPLAVKIAPDLQEEDIAAIADLLRRHRIEGVIATNTTLAREGVQGLPHSEETGGLSGAPLRARATAVVQSLAQKLQGEIPVIGVGGICHGDDAREKIAAGARLVQLYTGLIYRGPALVAECVRALAPSAAQSEQATISPPDPGKQKR